MFSIDTRPEKIVAAAGPGKAKRKRALKARERRLAGLVFGDDDLTGRLVGAAEDVMVDSADAEEEIASEVSEGAEDEGGDSGDDDDVDHDDASEDDATEGESADEGADKAGVQSRSAAAAAWVDDDDAVGEVDVAHGRARLKKLRRAVDEERLTAEEYQQRLRAQFLSMQPRPAWAARKQPAARDRGGGSADDQDGSEDEGVDAADEAAAQRVLRSGEPLLRADRGSLPPAELSVKRLVDLNAAEESRAVVRAVEWHPNGQLALTAGYDGTLRLFRVDGTANAKVQSVHVPKMQISSAAFTADGSQVLLCGRSRDWYAFDLHEGRIHRVRGVAGRSEAGFSEIVVSPDGTMLTVTTESGALLLVSARTKQLVHTVQGARSDKWGCQAAAFSPDGATLYSARAATVQVWDVRRRCCVHTFRERGGNRCTALAASADGALLAAGSDSGAVSVYATGGGGGGLLGSSDPAPTKEFLNLTTAVTHVGFNGTSELLSFSSKYLKGSMRMAHVAGQRVFPNWPTSKTPLNYVQCAAFSPGSGLFAAGNDKGKVLLYRLNHYTSA